ncbi:MAG: thioesterase family protein [Oscillospiraceae bacterium]
MNVIIGTTFEVNTKVNEQMLATQLKSGDVPVLATPIMVALMEQASSNCLAQFLEEGFTSVGTSIQTTHLCATPLNMQVKAVSEIIEVNNREIKFKVKAYDEKELIGEGVHIRFILNKEKFITKANEKLNK